MEKLFSLAAIAFCMAFSLTAHAQGDIFLLADGIKGTSTTVPGTIEVSSLGTGLACGGCSVTPAAGTIGTGKAVPGKIVFNMKSDVYLNTLKAYILRGVPNGTAYFIFSKTGINLKPGTPATDYYYIKLSNYTVIEINESAGGEGNTLQVSLGYSALTWTMKTQLSTSAWGNPQSYGWDFSKNMEITNPSAIPAGF